MPLVDSAWALYNGFMFEDHAYQGHAHSVSLWWHYHHSQLPPHGQPAASPPPYRAETALVGYAMDGFPIYGPLPAGGASGALCLCQQRLVRVKSACWCMHVQPCACKRLLHSCRTPGELDECNGRLVNGRYQYHMRRFEEVDFTLPQCSNRDRRQLPMTKAYIPKQLPIR